MALGSNAPRCAAGDCPEQLRFDFHQLHHEGLLMVSRVLVVNPERWRYFAVQCSDQFGCARQRLAAVHQLHHEGLLVVRRVLIVNPERLCGDAAHCKAMRGSEKQGFAASVSCLLSPRRASRHEARV